MQDLFGMNRAGKIVRAGSLEHKGDGSIVVHYDTSTRWVGSELATSKQDLEHLAIFVALSRVRKR